MKKIIALSLLVLTLGNTAMAESEAWPTVFTRNSYQCNFWRSSSSNFGEYVCSGYPSLSYQLDDQSLLRLLDTMKTRIESLEARLQKLEAQQP